MYPFFLHRPERLQALLEGLDGAPLIIDEIQRLTSLALDMQKLIVDADRRRIRKRISSCITGAIGTTERWTCLSPMPGG